ncbi:hypothetical protein EOM39_06955 [Candidatus Gracilibacteria bacterium]|nr:hypothetical protein [Candidatus Gracilibacteria bacterium]
MKLNIKDYIIILFLLLILSLILFEGLYLLQEQKYKHEHSLINQKYCLDLGVIPEDRTLEDITKCNMY